MYRKPEGRVEEGQQDYPVYEESKQFGMFGYPEGMINMAVSRDDEVAMKWMHQEGWITPETRTLDDKTMLEFLDKKHATRCREALEGLGYV